MMLDDVMAAEARHHAPGARWFGVYPALVKDIADPDGQGRVKVSLPWAPDLDGGSYEAWARLGTMMGGKNRGTWFVPDKDDEVVVFGVSRQILLDERADRDDPQPTPTSVVEAEPNERRRDATALMVGEHLGVDEGDPPVLDDVFEDAGELAVEVRLVASVLGRIRDEGSDR